MNDTCTELFQVKQSTLTREIPEVSLRFSRNVICTNDNPILQVEDIPDELLTYLAESSVEYMVLVTLGTDFRPINYSVIAKGTINCAIFSVTDLIRTCLLTPACFTCIILHNHTSLARDGVRPKPSPADKTISKKIFESLQMIGISVADFTIVGANKSVFSFLEEGMMPGQQKKEGGKDNGTNIYAY